MYLTSLHTSPSLSKPDSIFLSKFGMNRHYTYQPTCRLNILFYFQNVLHKKSEIKLFRCTGHVVFPTWKVNGLKHFVLPTFWVHQTGLTQPTAKSEEVSQNGIWYDDHTICSRQIFQIWERKEKMGEQREGQASAWLALENPACLFVETDVCNFLPLYSALSSCL